MHSVGVVEQRDSLLIFGIQRVEQIHARDTFLKPYKITCDQFLSFPPENHLLFLFDRYKSDGVNLREALRKIEVLFVAVDYQ